MSLNDTEGQIRFEDNKIQTFQRTALSSTENSQDVIVKDILALVVKRGFRNIAHVDPQKIIECYAEDFAERYEPILHEVRQEIQSVMELACIPRFC